MARLERIIDEARSLSYDEKQKLREALDAELDNSQPHNGQHTEITNDDDEETRKRRLDWLKTHREEYAGQYVALAGDILVGHGRTMREAHHEAKKNGVEDPFVVRL